jgi:hypothetical protein
MIFPIEIINIIEDFCNNETKLKLILLNKAIRMTLLQKYYGYILYSESSSLVYDTYKMSIHRNKTELDNYINSKNTEKHIISKYVRFTLLGRNVVKEFPSMRIFDETAYIHS